MRHLSLSHRKASNEWTANKESWRRSNKMGIVQRIILCLCRHWQKWISCCYMCQQKEAFQKQSCQWAVGLYPYSIRASLWQCHGLHQASRQKKIELVGLESYESLYNLNTANREHSRIGAMFRLHGVASKHRNRYLVLFTVIVSYAKCTDAEPSNDLRRSLSTIWETVTYMSSQSEDLLAVWALGTTILTNTNSI